VSIAVQGNSVYYTQYEDLGAIWGVPSGGGSAAVVVAAQKLPSSLFATDAALYWVNEGTNEVVRRPAVPPSLLARFNSGVSMAGGQVAAFGTSAFWTSPGGIGAGDAGEVHYSASFPSDQPIQTGLDHPMAIAVDATYVYFAASSGAGKEQVFRAPPGGVPLAMAPQAHHGIRALAVSATGAVALAAADAVGQSPSLIDPFVPAAAASPSSFGVGVVIDEARGTYFLMSNGVIHHSAGGTFQTSQVAGCPSGRGLAQDDTYLYLACESSIWRVPK
jgi:hypothetical protein